MLGVFFAGYEAFVVPPLAADPATLDLVGPGGAILASRPFAAHWRAHLGTSAGDPARPALDERAGCRSD